MCYRRVWLAQLKSIGWVDGQLDVTMCLRSMWLVQLKIIGWVDRQLDVINIITYSRITI